ncbi:hypothetical protein B0H14DRAFT_3174758 [Mycena olivaceomarginata]|nr:hypothetical protein B0H14DRAFT_3174758 [Mycena olivaceomarginata]
MAVKATLLIIGPGLIGGSLLTEFLKTDQYVLTVMARSADQIAVLSTLGVKTIQAGLQDLEAIGSAVEAHDSLRMLPGAEDFRPDQRVCTLPSTELLSPTAPHRAVDLAWYNASQELAGKVKIAIYIPATAIPKISIQIPAKIEAALHDGYASYGNDGQATFTHISVGDLVVATTILLDALENSKVDVLNNPYFNASTHVETTWFAVAERIGADLYAKGRIATPAPRSSGPEYDFYGACAFQLRRTRHPVRNPMIHRGVVVSVGCLREILKLRDSVMPEIHWRRSRPIESTFKVLMA